MGIPSDIVIGHFFASQWSENTQAIVNREHAPTLKFAALLS